MGARACKFRDVSFQIFVCGGEKLFVTFQKIQNYTKNNRYLHG